MRIVGGDARGRTLHAVPGSTTRPTADRVRQSLFDVLGQRCDGLRVLDLYAGTGALSLEALSRGAVSATLVEKDAKACAVIERNVAELGFGERCTLLREDVGRALLRLRAAAKLSDRAPPEAAGQGRFELILSDPPYALRAAQATLEAAAPLLAPGGRAVLEMDKREPLPSGLPLLDERLYGDTRVAIFEAE